MGYKKETVEALRKFRVNMGSDLYQNDAKNIFRSIIHDLPIETESEIVQKKMQYAKSYVKYLKVLNLVQYIGVSGSVGAGIAKENDDIDFFVVVKNNTLWIYRGLMLVKNLFNPKMRKADTDNPKDMICLNLIAECRGLKFENDLFNLHELYYLKSVYNPEFYDEILANNQWVRRWGGVVQAPDPKMKRFNVFLEALNLYFFLPQLLFMLVTRHSPEIKRILINYMKGRIEFFKQEYKGEKLENLNQ